MSKNYFKKQAKDFLDKHPNLSSDVMFCINSYASLLDNAQEDLEQYAETNTQLMNKINKIKALVKDI